MNSINLCSSLKHKRRGVQESSPCAHLRQKGGGRKEACGQGQPLLQSEFKASLDYVVRPCIELVNLRKKKKSKTKTKIA